jgi:hypothetical protein
MRWQRIRRAVQEQGPLDLHRWGVGGSIWRAGKGTRAQIRQRRGSQARTAAGVHSNPSSTSIRRRRRQVSLDPVAADKDAVAMEVLRPPVSSSPSSSGAGGGSDGVAAGGRRGGRQDRAPPPPRRRPPSFHLLQRPRGGARHRPVAALSLSISFLAGVNNHREDARRGVRAAGGRTVLGAGFLLCVALKGSICLWRCAPLLWTV